MQYETVIGLEVHVELGTASKLFCGCANQFGGAPNTLVCPVCLGMPGVLPVVNRKAVELHLKAARALNCAVPPISKFDRKNYFYPDMPKNFQTSQFDLPLATAGRLEIGPTEGPSRSIGITRIHLEEDTGKSVHYRTINGQLVPDRLASSELSLVDYNRAGVPLMEIVSEPEIRTPDEAVSYLQNLRDILVWLEISDCRMEEGSMRCDANISIRPMGSETLGNRTEIKNMNSFKSVRLALDFEIARQIEVVSGGGRIVQETRGWDEARNLTHSMRSKEEAHDYRYFPEPDLPRMEIAEGTVAEIDANLGELPRARSERYTREFGLSVYDANLMVANRATANLFDSSVSEGAEAKDAANWISNEVPRLGADHKLTGKSLARLLAILKSGSINRAAARQVLGELAEHGGEPVQVVEKLGLAGGDNADELRAWVEAAVAANPQAIAEFRAGKGKALNTVVGQVMKASKGRANPAEVNRILQEVLGG